MEKTGKKPNIIMILADDQGPWAMHCAGTPELYTPNLDRIAEQGMRFDSFFCASPVCSPARASILTGKMPSAHGVQDWLRSGNLDGERFAAQGKENPYFEGYKQERKPIWKDSPPTRTFWRRTAITVHSPENGTWVTASNRSRAFRSGTPSAWAAAAIITRTWWSMEKSPCIMGNM